MDPVISPPWTWTNGIFIYAAHTAVAMVSNRSAIVTTTSGWRSLNTVASSAKPSPVDLAEVMGFSFQNHVNPTVDGESFFFHDVVGAAVSIEES